MKSYSIVIFIGHKRVKYEMVITADEVAFL